MTIKTKKQRDAEALARWTGQRQFEIRWGAALRAALKKKSKK